ncbi:hypothetical protein [Streptomyces sp. NPDC049040]|uniref:hypothetical protein n=1 Tax=Streptomyces sp. NPDC049040 TaxID=3365593 RepID=UPI00372056A5
MTPKPVATGAVTRAVTRAVTGTGTATGTGTGTVAGTAGAEGNVREDVNVDVNSVFFRPDHGDTRTGGSGSPPFALVRGSLRKPCVGLPVKADG